MTNEPQQPSGEEPQDLNQDSEGLRGSEQGHSTFDQGTPGDQQGKRGQQPGAYQEQGTQRGSYQEQGTQRGSYQEQGTQRGSYQQRGAEQQRGSYAVREEKPHHKSRLPLVAAGIVGLLLLGGLIGGLVAAFGGNSAKHVSLPTHAPAAPAKHVPAGGRAGTMHLLKQFQYVGPRVSGPFKVPSPVDSHYIYRCPRGAGPFDAKMTNASGSDTQTIAKTSGPGGTSSVTLHPKFPGTAYHLDVSTKCEYRIQVIGK